MVAAPVWGPDPVVAGSVIVGDVTYEVKVINFSFGQTDGNPKTVITAVPAKVLWVVGYWFWASLTAELEWRSNTTVVQATQYVGARTQIGGSFLPGYFMKTAVGEAVTLRQINTTQAAIRGPIHYVEVTP